ncbi:DUF4306 domain-containing protein [Sporosarcina sp.]|uniref:DUF4306 domain-containing protein n=1 Tax=Sporosarcina sp. TaxID=49982 RepID=UPI00345B6B3B
MLNLLILLFSLLVSIYEGSEILNTPWEWEHTAIFSNLTNEQLKTTKDILLIDYFIFAAKFSPIYPIVSLIATYSITFQIIFWIKNKLTRIISFWLITFISIILMITLKNSPTQGLHLISILFGLSTFISISIALFLIKNNMEKNTSID